MDPQVLTTQFQQKLIFYLSCFISPLPTYFSSSFSSLPLPSFLVFFLSFFLLKNFKETQILDHFPCKHFSKHL